MTRPAETLRVGDVIFPPAREVSLWMRRNARERGLPDTALYLTVRAVVRHLTGVQVIRFGAVGVLVVMVLEVGQRPECGEQVGRGGDQPGITDAIDGRHRGVIVADQQ